MMVDKMVKYRVPQSEIDNIIKNRVLALVRHYTMHEGFLDIDKINPDTILARFGVTVKDAKRVITSLISEGKIEKI